MRFARVLIIAAACLSIRVWGQTLPGGNKNVSLMSHLHNYAAYSNIWGYTSDDGREYALLGANTGLSIIDITSPRLPVEVAFVPGPGPTSWREIKTWAHYAYVVSEGTSPTKYTGIQVVDLSKLPQVSYHSAYWDGVAAGNARAHTVAVDSAGYLYIQGGTATLGGGLNQGGVRILSLADPNAPVSVGLYTVFYVHDSFAKGNLLFCSNYYQGGHVDILDISDRTRPKLLTTLAYPDGGSHNSATTEDGRYLITTDEKTGKTVKFWDIQVLWDNNPDNDNNIELVAEYIGDPAQIAHNVHVKGHYAYISHYAEGVKVLDISNPRAPVEVGSYDTYPQSGSGFVGAWGVFPYFRSGNFVVSDMQTGLYVLRLDIATNTDDPQPSVGLPQQFKLSAAYPNPLRLQAVPAETVLSYELPEAPAAARVSLKVYDILGREVRTLLDAAYQPGKFTLRWNGHDQTGTPVTSGVYFLKLTAGVQQQVSKITVVR